MIDKLRKSSRKIAIAVVGGVVLIAGIIMIPYPGPGWLVVFAGLAILAQEFAWAQDALEYVKAKYAAWQQWVKQQSFMIQVLFWLVTFIMVVATIWLLNGYGIVNRWLGLHQDWTTSPLPFF